MLRLDRASTPCRTPIAPSGPWVRAVLRACVQKSGLNLPVSQSLGSISISRKQCVICTLTITLLPTQNKIPVVLGRGDETCYFLQGRMHDLHLQIITLCHLGLFRAAVLTWISQLHVLSARDTSFVKRDVASPRSPCSRFTPWKT